jgi:hypothetical protein
MFVSELVVADENRRAFTAMGYSMIRRDMLICHLRRRIDFIKSFESSLVLLSFVDGILSVWAKSDISLV